MGSHWPLEQCIQQHNIYSNSIVCTVTLMVREMSLWFRVSHNQGTSQWVLNVIRNLYNVVVLMPRARK